ncbi:hypothetical protein PR048_016380 [Dryococelus australis]|uniref:Uncharacterized protein n=1 Tax=Dryococelus australis TaxID=614101 RepID=A0ABQ9HJK6_9NEOP|nr:hypothetical protein PR048_016380 [Dryococelus australis]
MQNKEVEVFEDSCCNTKNIKYDCCDAVEECLDHNMPTSRYDSVENVISADSYVNCGIRRENKQIGGDIEDSWLSDTEVDDSDMDRDDISDSDARSSHSDYFKPSTSNVSNKLITVNHYSYKKTTGHQNTEISDVLETDFYHTNDDECNNTTPLNNAALRKLSFKPPEVDTCDLCDTFQARLKGNTLGKTDKNIITAEYESHLFESKRRYNQKILTGSFQKCLPAPSLTNCLSFYKRMLWTLNYILFDSSDKRVHCMMWDKGKVGRGEYLLKGHTDMEADNIHSLIERKRKKINDMTILTPWDWQQIVRECSSNYHLHNMEQEDLSNSLHFFQEEVRHLFTGKHVLKKRRFFSQLLF